MAFCISHLASEALREELLNPTDYIVEKERERKGAVHCERQNISRVEPTTWRRNFLIRQHKSGRCLAEGFMHDPYHHWSRSARMVAVTAGM
jgi:hypothetical protein